MEDKVLITNIQRFCLHDGPGIRTTIFFKGCSVCCPWCENPENIRSEIEWYTEKRGDKDKIRYYGQYFSCAELFTEIIKDKEFYHNGGGVTFSGGEPLLVFPKLEELFGLLQKEKIESCAETALFVSSENVQIAIRHLKSIIIDLKILSPKGCREYIGGDLKQFYQNIQLVEGANLGVIYRIPMIKPYTTNECNINNIITFLDGKKYSIVEMVIGHNLGGKKYQYLNRTGYNVPELTESELADISDKFEKRGIDFRVCKI